MQLHQWDGQRRGFYEAYFMLLRDERGRAVWMRWLLLVPKAGCGDATVTRWLMWTDADGQPHVDRCTIAQGASVTGSFWQGLCESLVAGDITGGSEQGAVSYQIRWESVEAGRALFPYSWMYAWDWPRSKVNTPADQLRIDGRIMHGAHTLQFYSAPGMLGHLWGADMADSWAWLHTNTIIEDPDASLELLSGNVRLVGASLPTLSLARLHLDGRNFWFNAPSAWLTAKTSWDPSGWSFETQQEGYRLWARTVAPTPATIGVTYNAPDGSRRYCYHNDHAHLYGKLSERSGTTWRTLYQFHASQSARFEAVSREPNSQLPLYL